MTNLLVFHWEIKKEKITDINTDFFEGSSNVSRTLAQDILKLSGFL